MPFEPVSQSHLTAVATVGTRVVLRVRLPEAEVAPGGPRHTDVIGEVRAIDARALTLDTRRGRVRVLRDRVVLARKVPPAPVRRARPSPTPVSPAGDPPGAAVAIERLQLLMTAGMPPLSSERLGDWLLRAADNYTGRANSALPVGDPGVPLPEAVERVVAWYAARRQPALIQLAHEAGADPRASDLGSLLAERQWHFVTRTLVLTRTTASADRPFGGAVRVEVADRPTDDWWDTAPSRSLQHRGSLTRMLESIPDAAYLTAYEHRVPVGHARLVIGDGWSGVFDVHTAPAARRRGVARALLAQADRVAAGRRLPLQYLQVAADNTAAVGLYESLGWQVHHDYHYATLP